MKIHDCLQGTEHWLRLRAGIITASELDNIVTVEGELRKGEMPKTYAATKVVERWTGYPMQSFSGGVMEQGSILEDEAIPWIETQLKCDLARPGFISNDEMTFGASPDAMLGVEGFEIKCPQPVNHVKWLLAGGCPKEHLLQCMGGMLVTGAPCWNFVSYCRGFPNLMVRVERDEAMLEQLAEAVLLFSRRIDADYAMLVAKNGGEPRRRLPRPRPTVDDDPFASTAPDYTTEQMNQRITDQHMLREETR